MSLRHSNSITPQTERNRKAIRYIIILVLIAAVLFSLGALKILSLSQENSTQNAEIKRTQKLIVAQAQERHDQRVFDQAKTDAQVKQLACIIVSQSNERDPKTSLKQRLIIIEFRTEYGCPPYSKANAANPFPPKPSSGSRPVLPGPVNPSVAPSPTPSQRSPSGTPGAAGRTPSASARSSVAARTPARHAPSAPARATPAPSSSRLLPPLQVCVPLVACVSVK